MNYTTGAILFLVLVSLVSLSGCSTLQAPLTGLSTIDPSEMAIQLSDLPEGYMKIQAESISPSDNYQNMGPVKKGYQVGFSKGTSSSDAVLFSQIIVVMPKDQIDQVIPKFQNEVQKAKGTSLSNPDIGDVSAAYRIEDSQNHEMFVILFIKQDVFEMVMMGGTQTDYEMLKSIAKTAEGKIK